MYFPDIEEVLDVFTFQYVIPHSPSAPGEASPLQLISPGLYETAWAFDQIAVLPRDAAELLLDSKQLIEARIAGRGLSVLPTPTNLLARLLSKLNGRLVVLLSSGPQLAATVDEILKEWPHPVLKVSPDDPPLTRAALRDFCLSIATHWLDRPAMRHHAKTLQEGLDSWRDPLERQDLEFMDRHHFLTLPNVAALESVGYFARPWNEQPLVGSDNEPYFAALRESVRPILTIRDKLIAEHAHLGARARTDLILTVPSVMKHWSAQGKEALPFGSVREKKILKQVLRQIVTRESYNFSLTIPDNSNMAQALSSPMVQSLLSEHRKDLQVYAQMLAIRAASSFTPVIRIPPAANGAFTELSQLAAACRSYVGGVPPHKLNRLARALSERLARGLPEWMLEVIRHSDRIKLASDVPLEWLSLDGFPLMLQSDTSRIPVTPGNAFVQLMLQCVERPIPSEAFQNVLVVRSFRSRDPIRSQLESCIELFKQRDPSQFPRVRIVDIETRADLIRALNSFDGAIVVYDGHGLHDKSTDVGAMALASEQVSPWSLRGEARIPPIVLLSACDTHPLDSSHATVGNGFLAAGAITVLATSMPVQAMHSAVMIARLLFRVGCYLPLLLKHRSSGSFRWSEILPGLQRRQFTTDAFQTLSRIGILKGSDDALERAQIDVGMAIDTGGGWLELLIERTADLASCSHCQAKELLRKHVAFADSLLYTQLGNPELIVGVTLKK